MEISGQHVQVSHACIECGVKFSRLTNNYNLCEPCFAQPLARHQYVYGQRPLDPIPCPYPPGTPEKIEWMRNRVENNQSPCSPLDPTYNGFKPGIVQPSDHKPEVFALPKLRCRGVERINNRWRVRPCYGGRKYDMGVFHSRPEAEAVCRRWWIAKLGIFWELGGNMWRYRRPRRRCKEKRTVNRRASRSTTPHPTLFDYAPSWAA